MKFQTQQYWIIIISFFLFNIGKSQGLIQVRALNTNYSYFGPNELWNIQTFSTKNKLVKARIEAFVTNSFGVLIYQSTTGIVDIKPGIDIFNVQNLVLIKNSVLDRNIDQYLRMTQMFPNGNYSVCYTIRETNNTEELDTENPITNCIELISEIQTPLILNTPMDGSELETTRPNFTWIPPVPIGTINGFNYNFYLYGAAPKKTCEEVITQSSPIYRVFGVQSNSLTFPNELNSLDTSKHYCWKVDGILNKAVVASSEIWRFKIKREKLKFDTIKYLHFVENAAIVNIPPNTIVMCDFDGAFSGDTLMAFITGNDFQQEKINFIRVADDFTKTEPSSLYSHSKYLIDPQFLKNLKQGLYVIKSGNKSLKQKYLKINIQ